MLGHAAELRLHLRGVVIAIMFFVSELFRTKECSAEALEERAVVAL
ncbi:MAG: hypothetical protein QOF02_1762 [Blastocatellia bacterium]|jgi:hypothetical protein|nr:hypothetical protein [Blastocatellia bacterium]